jgi:hypothetical protein
VQEEAFSRIGIRGVENGIDGISRRENYTSNCHEHFVNFPLDKSDQENVSHWKCDGCSGHAAVEG